MTEDKQALLNAALVRAQAEVGNATKDRTGQVGQQKYKYADIAAVDNAVDKALEDNGLALSLWPGLFENNCVHCTIELSHVAGGCVTREMSIPIAQQTAQAYGSAITYARRYATTSILRVVTTDDDGQAASTPQQRRETTPAREQSAPADNSVSRPAQSATAASSRVPFTAKDMRGPAEAKNYPTSGLVGAYLNSTPDLAAPTDEALAEHQEANPGITMAALLTDAANWFVDVGPDGEVKDRVLAWLGENE